MAKRKLAKSSVVHAGPAYAASAAIPLSRPNPENLQPRTKTLYEIAAERQAKLGLHGALVSSFPNAAEDLTHVKINFEGRVEKTVDLDSIDAYKQEAQTITPVLDTVFMASSLSALHFTLEVLTVHQYAQELRFPPIIKDTILIAFPALCFTIHLFHGHLLALSSRQLPSRFRGLFPVLQQLVYLVIANIAGCYLIYTTNDKGYYAVMKSAPSIGTIWVWCILELGLGGALAGVAGPGLYAWRYGYGVF